MQCGLYACGQQEGNLDSKLNTILPQLHKGKLQIHEFSILFVLGMPAAAVAAPILPFEEL